jgi:uncharacterized membrane protein
MSLTTLSLLLLVLFYVLTPVLIIRLTQKVPLAGKLGSILIAYLLGLLVGNIGILPDGATPLQNLMTTLTVPMAIPLLLFSLNIRRWTHLAGRTGLSMGLALVALIIMLVTGHLLLHEHINDSAQVAGMLVGVYSGGTPNLASIYKALNVDETTYLLTHTYDMLLCALYLLLLISFGKPLLRRWLPKFKTPMHSAETAEDQFTTENYSGIFRKRTFLPMLAGVGIAVLIFGIGGGASLLVPDHAEMLTVILTITTLGIAASLIPKVNRIPRTFEAGMYLILVFSLVVASQANLSNIKIESLYLFLFVAIAVFGTLILHIILARIFRIDADTLMITSVAMVFSPPFVPMMAGVLKNRHIILSGLTVGILGYAIGNYLGVLLALLLG